ncbi:MAG: T9SS type A sorting domain-containing protein [Taibaiella sp.]|nr:T9SS type A sorting domain-containing protein [Taibaiella sp.]
MQKKFTHSPLKSWRNTFLAMLGFSLLPVSAFSQTPPPASAFSINGSTYYQVLNNQLYQYNQDGSRTLLATYGNTSTHDLNAIGFNPKDSMIWGYNMASSNFFRIGSVGSSEYWEFTVSGVSSPGNLFNVGTIDTNGYLYVYQSNQASYYTIDLNPAHSTTYLKAINPGTGALKTAAPYGTTISPLTISDWAANRTDGFIYSIIEGHAPVTTDRFRIVRINPANGTSTLLTGTASGSNFQQPNDGSSWGYGTSFIDSSGNLYAFNNFNGIFYKVNNFTVNGTKTVTVVNNSGITGNQKNDGAFPIMVDYISTPLPVSLCCFQATIGNNKAALLSWSTLSEERNLGFEVQHSLNGTNWNSKGFVYSKAAQGKSKKKLDYSMEDRTAQAGKNMYRLKQVDFDGTASYSDVSTLDLETGSLIHIHPNPVTTSFNIEGLSAGTKIQVTDVNGSTIKEVSAVLPTLQIDLSDQPAGIYFLNITDTNGALTRHKVLKQ